MIGRTPSRYQMTAKLGEGGMGVGYKAFDTSLDRVVAIKVLCEENSTTPQRRFRFIQEAKAASALNHPNIKTVFDIDQAEGMHFIVLEYVLGSTLDQVKVAQLEDSLRIAVQIADLWRLLMPLVSSTAMSSRATLFGRARRCQIRWL
jgi:serine/threonine protein kinase